MGLIHSKITKIIYILKNLIPIIIFILISIFLFIIFLDYDLWVIISGSLLILITPIITVRNCMRNLVKTGFNNYDKIREYMDELEEKYGEILRYDLTEINLLLSNERHFLYLFFELFISAYKYSLEVRESFYVRDKGWIKRSYKSSRNALMRYLSLYSRTYEGLFQFFITYLIVLIMIKRNFYYKVKKSVLNGSTFKLNNKYALYYLNKKFESKFESPEEIIRLSELEKKYFNLNHYFLNPPNSKNINKKRDGIIKYFRRMSIDQVIIKGFEKFNNQSVLNVLRYKSCFYDIYQSRPIKAKMDFLKENHYDFTDWIIPQLRHKSVHHLNWIFTKAEKGESCIEVIMGTLKGKKYDVYHYWNSLCRLYALCYFLMENMIYKENLLIKNNRREFKISFKKINKYFKKKNNLSRGNIRKTL